MGPESSSTQGGFHFGAVAGSVSINAGGDVVGGDKVTTTVQLGFGSEEQRQAFQAKIDELRDVLATLRREIESNTHLKPEAKQEITTEISQGAEALRDVREQACTAPAGRATPPDTAAKVKAGLEHADSVISTVQRVAEKSVGIAGTVGRFVAEYGPLLLRARHLFGLP